jgi:hypothetical protein
MCWGYLVEVDVLYIEDFEEKRESVDVLLKVIYLFVLRLLLAVLINDNGPCM